MSENVFKRIFAPKGRGKLWWIFIFVLVLALASFFVDFGREYNNVIDKYNVKLPHATERPFRLGLDLLGGTQLIYEADVSAIPAADRAISVEGARDVIEKRVNFFGVSEPVVQVNHTTEGDYRILVELAGVKDVKEAIKKIGETPLLEFKEENTEKVEMTEEQTQAMLEYNVEVNKKAEEVLAKAKTGEKFYRLVKDYGDNESEDTGWITGKTTPLVALVKDLENGQVFDTVIDLGGLYEIVKMEDKRIQKDEDGNDAVEIKASHLLICYNESETCESGLTKDEAYEKIKEIAEKATPENFKELVKQNSTEPGAKESYGDLKWFTPDTMVEPFKVAVVEQEIGTISYVVETKFGYHLIYKEDQRGINEYKLSHVALLKQTEEDVIGLQGQWKNTKLSGKQLKRATVQFNPNDNTPEISLEFDEEGSELFEEITYRNINKPVAIFLDGYPISIPNVNEKITGGKAVISGTFTLVEAKKLVKELNAGALPVPIKLINQQTIGASLGQESVANSMKAGIFGLILVALFMILIYRLPGVLAVVSLIIYGLIILAVFKLWPVTMTLSGIAGLILSIGMAVDANVLIFERFKEELKAGRSLSRAVDEGFARAWTSIRDGNFTTILVCLVLIYFSTSIIKGFAITLFLGVLISMFTAIVVTKNFLKLLNERWLEKHPWLAGIKKTKSN